jgi:hypothetical protein
VTRPRIGLVVAWCLLATVSAPGARAQVCDGFASLRDRHFRVTASEASYSYATALAGSFTAGSTLFGTVAAGSTHDSELDATTFDIGLEAGADLPTSGGFLFLCPAAAATLSLGPYDFLLEGTTFRYVDRAVRLGAALMAIPSPGLKLVVTGGLSAARVSVVYWPSAEKRATGSEGWSASTNYWLWSAGVGLVVNDRFTVRPSLTVPVGFPAAGTPTDWAVPFGREDSELSFGISFGISF